MPDNAIVVHADMSAERRHGRYHRASHDHGAGPDGDTRVNHGLRVDRGEGLQVQGRDPPRDTLARGRVSDGDQVMCRPDVRQVADQSKGFYGSAFESSHVDGRIGDQAHDIPKTHSLEDGQNVARVAAGPDQYQFHSPAPSLRSSRGHDIAQYADESLY
jgi:hypothetical protein